MNLETAAGQPVKNSKPIGVSTKALAPTLGRTVCDWITEYLVHSTGDWLGKRFRLARWQRRLIYQLYEMRGEQRSYNRALIGLPKGSGKTELAAALACYEFCGPTAPRSPEVVVAANSRKQAGLVYENARLMLTLGPLAGTVEDFENEIKLIGRPGKLYRIAAEAGANDGLRPTFVVFDELHEFDTRTARVHLVLENGLTKRPASWGLAISTAGWDTTSLLYKLYTAAKRGEAGGRYYFHWREASGEYDLDDPEQRMVAVREAYPPDSPWVDLDAVSARYAEIPDYEWRRYYLNQWTSAPSRWIPAGVLEAAARPGPQPPNSTPIVMGFDGSYSRDATAIVGCEIPSGRLFVMGLWEKGVTDGKSWRVPVKMVEASIEKACQTWQVVRIGCDPFRWQQSIAELGSKGLPVEEVPSHSARIAPAATGFMDALTGGRVTHDGDPNLVRHFGNCSVKIDRYGARPVKEHPDSTRHIDLAVAAIIAWDLRERVLGSGSKEAEEIECAL